ncbi:MAG: universal stress protein, partial [Caldilineae bacterium]
MFTHLLVPLDGSQTAEAVLPAVERLATLLGCGVTLLHVIEADAPERIHGDVHMTAPHEAETYLEKVADHLRQAGVDVDLHVHTVPVGDVPRSIAEHADELGQDLIVLCSHGGSGPRRFVVGSNAEQVLDHGTTPVLLIQPDAAEPQPAFGPNCILALVDNAPGGEQAVEAACTLAARAKSALHLLAVVPTLQTMSAELAASGWFMPHTTREILNLTAEEARQHLEAWVQRCAAQGVTAQGRVERGDPAPVIVDLAQELGADLVVLPVRGLAGLRA